MKNKIKKTIIILIIIILSFQIFQKFDFIFFKVQVCNETDSKMLISIYGNKKEFFNIDYNKLLKKVFTNYEAPIEQGKKISFLLKSNTCSEYKNTNLFSTNYFISSKILKNDISYIECKSGTTDLLGDIKNMSYGKYIFNINKYKIIEYNKKGFNYKYCHLFLEKIEID
ncbi:MAG: hypothetical protein Q9M94_03430 [Candidatus Gracilibacteria bacterium]|nr:hypothetical protein [Candidatus Gracilibacteria bacterium]MDQ7022238.1 hypothetical protein [Candidatus Gracilibacteria bacterium]